MASMRRTKNFALDGQTPIFLYSILKQLDLRSIDWNMVAESLDISNGHAARMRYSRMRTQFEGMSKEAKPPKHKKDNEAKAAKEKAAKGKRALLEEETERLGTDKHSVRASGQAHKRPKIGHQHGSNPWVSSVMPGQQYTNSFWPHPHLPTIKAEPTTDNGSSVTTAPLIKKDPEILETFNNSNGETHIKQEQTVKEEPNTNDDVLQELPPVQPSTEENNELAAISMKQDPSYPTTYYYPTYRYGNVPGAFHHQNAPGYYQTFPMPAGHSAYPMQQTYAYNPWIGPRQSINPWTQSAMAAPIAPAAATTTAHPENMIDNNIPLNPHASSYEDLLNMPLYTGTPHNFQFDVTTPELILEDQNVTEALVSTPAQDTTAVAVEQPTTNLSNESQPGKEKTKSSSPPVLDLSSDTVPGQPFHQNAIENSLSEEQPKTTTEVTLASGVNTEAQVSPSGLVVDGDQANVGNEADAEHDVDDEHQATTIPIVVKPEKESSVVVIESEAGAIEADKIMVVIKPELVEILDP